ncbi:hypothetical protein [Pseudonocardia sp. N23]|uniref:hypothetical protein n=1 Tax=Pseudonocardia sp. N23 TaxID=1987376 RepID=UPI0011458FB1|nr:hypothetical protein [Pseudonocardia sp. N23]
MAMKLALAGLGAALLIVGLALGLSSHSVTRMSGSELDCGSAWSPELANAKSQDDLINSMVYGRYRGLGLSSDYEDKCVAELGGLGTTAAILSIFGGAVIVGVGFLAAAQSGSRRTEPGAPASDAATPPDPVSLSDD